MSLSFHPFLIYKICILYLVLPILFFFIGWLRLGMGVALSVLLLLSSVSFLNKIKSSATNDEPITLSKEYYIAFIILFLFLFCTGNTGFVGCWGIDIPWRNAIYQDLIHQSWPVIYDYSHSMLCYYMVFWLVPAELTSLLHLNELGSNVVLLMWMYIGLILIFFLLCILLKPKKEQIILITVMFLFFSGINTFGVILKSILFGPVPLISEFPGRISWSFSDYSINGIDIVFIIRDTYLNIADVYNQFFAIAIATLLFYRFRANVEFYWYIGLLVLPYSPLGFIGLFVIIFLEFVFTVLTNKELSGLKACIKKILSNENVLSALSLVPIFYLYYSMNLHASTILRSHQPLLNSISYIPWNKLRSGELIFLFFVLIQYYYLYFLIYARLIYNTYKQDSIFWEIIICLIAFPFIKIGKGADFNFNASTSSYLFLCLFIIKYLLQTINSNSFKIKDIFLVFFLSIAMLTPLIQITTSFRSAYLNNSICFKWSPWLKELKKDSFADKNIVDFSNFLAGEYDSHIFYLYFSKRKS